MINKPLPIQFLKHFYRLQIVFIYKVTIVLCRVRLNFSKMNRNFCQWKQPQKWPNKVEREIKFFTLYFIAYNSLWQHFFTYLLDWKTSDLHLAPEEFYKKRFVLKNCVKTHLKIFLIKLFGIPDTCIRRSSLLL